MRQLLKYTHYEFEVIFKDSGSLQHYEQMSVFRELTLRLERSCLLRHSFFSCQAIPDLSVVSESAGDSINNAFLHSPQCANICNGVFPSAGGYSSS